jgi:hypothetical protein
MLREFQPDVLLRVPDEEDGDDNSQEGIADPQVERLGPQTVGGGYVAGGRP